MALQVPNFSNPFSTTPLSAGYAWIDLVVSGFASDTGRLRLSINFDAASMTAGKTPVRRMDFILGDDGGLPKLSQIMADNPTEFNLIMGWYYTNLATLSLFPNATVVGNSLNIPNYNNPYSVTTPANAYGIITDMVMDLTGMSSSLFVTVYDSVDSFSAGKLPITTVEVILGQTAGMPPFSQFITDNISNYQNISIYLYTKLSPLFPDSSLVA
jgi:hypothetical protein